MVSYYSHWKPKLGEHETSLVLSSTEHVSPPLPPLEGMILWHDTLPHDTFTTVDNNGSLGVADVPMGRIQNLMSEFSLHVHSLNAPIV